MLMIRLQRVGRKHEPTFRLVLTDSKNSTKSGRYLEVLGNHDPRHKDKTVVDADRVKHWISKGAQVSDTVHNMLISKKLITGKKVNVLPKKSPIKKEGDAQPTPKAPAGEAASEATPVA
jgi:small subunit ribosomal protein S16